MWRALPLGYQLLIEFVILAGIAGFLAFVHHRIYQEGYDAAMVEVRAAEAARLAQAAKDIQTIGVKHAANRQKNASQAGYGLPACPVSAGAVDRLYSRSPASSKRSAGRLHSAPGTGKDSHGTGRNPDLHGWGHS